METKKEKQIVPKGETYRAVFYFFEKLANLETDNLSLILNIHGSMQLLQDGAPVDSSIEDKWQDALTQTEKEIGKNNKRKFTQHVAFNLIKIFYEENSAKPGELKDIMNHIEKNENPVDQYWEEAWKRAKTDKEGVVLTSLIRDKNGFLKKK